MLSATLSIRPHRLQPFTAVAVALIAYAFADDRSLVTVGEPMNLKRTGKGAFRIDIASLHAACEANYARLLQLFPDYEHANHREFHVGPARVSIEVLERSRYTTFFRLRQLHADARWLGQLQIDVRAYHDAGMLEVGAFQSHCHIAASYSYPNRQMLQRDEKVQQNLFLSDWLAHCLANGRAPGATAAAR